MLKIPIIAIDGPSGVGKSTTAKLVAERLCWHYLDTGAMYRAAALALKQAGVSINNQLAVKRLLNNITIQQLGDKELLNGIDISKTIRVPEITQLASAISANGEVRNAMVAKQRQVCKSGCWVIDGRDIGTVVFPNACCKIYLTADAEVRALRRFKELQLKGNLSSLSLSAVAKDLEHRDLADSTRAIAPLCKATDAVELDSSTMSLLDVVNWILSKHNKHQSLC